MAASTRTTLVLRVSCIPSRPTSRTVGLPRLSLVSLPGAFSVSLRHASLGTLVYLLWRRTPPPHVLPWRTAQGQATASVVVQTSPFPQAEQFLFTVVHEFLHFILHMTRSFVFVVLMNNPAYAFCILCCPSVPAPSSPASPLSAVPPLLGQLDVRMFLFVQVSRLCCSHQHERVDACLCIFLASAFQLVAHW